MVVIIDYQMGNAVSIANMVRRFADQVCISGAPEVIGAADRLILPGVGSFDSGMDNLKKTGLLELLNKKVISDKLPILGICLGMQLFCKRSEEGVSEGLGWVNASVERFKTTLKIPHMGWNNITLKKDDALTSSLGPEPRFYFAHSYHLRTDSGADVVATSEYGYSFPAIIRHENITGVQFHPEKSHRFGLSLLKQWAQLP